MGGAYNCEVSVFKKRLVPPFIQIRAGRCFLPHPEERFLEKSGFDENPCESLIRQNISVFQRNPYSCKKGLKVVRIRKCESVVVPSAFQNDRRCAVWYIIT